MIFCAVRHLLVIVDGLFFCPIRCIYVIIDYPFSAFATAPMPEWQEGIFRLTALPVAT